MDFPFITDFLYCTPPDSYTASIHGHGTCMHALYTLFLSLSLSLSLFLGVQQQLLRRLVDYVIGSFPAFRTLDSLDPGATMPDSGTRASIR